MKNNHIQTRRYRTGTIGHYLHTKNELERFERLHSKLTGHRAEALQRHLQRLRKVIEGYGI